MRLRRVALALIAIMAALYGLGFLRSAIDTGSAPPPAAATDTSYPPPRASAIEGLEARRTLTSLRVAAAGPLDGYSPDAWGGWDQYGECDTHTIVMQSAGTGIVSLGHCRLAGVWTSSYDGRETSNTDTLTVDHLVGLGQAWRSGARGWTPQQRHRFATDLSDLVVVTASVAAGKPTDADPSTWRPPDRGDWCRFAVDWIRVKNTWDLTVTTSERDALGGMLATCPQG
jgi:hypothetical protein